MQWTRERILDELVQTMVEMFEMEPADVVPEAHLIDDLDLDSIDAIDMAVRLQEMTGKRVDEESLRQVRTVGDVVDLVERLVKEP